jgi:hypothetical protein
MQDILGLKPYGEAIKIVVKKTIEGVEAFLSAACKPALDELGQMMRDQLRVWTPNNALNIVEKAKGNSNSRRERPIYSLIRKSHCQS